MTVQRVLPQSVVSEIEKQFSEEAYIAFLTIYADSLYTPIRVVSDPEYFILDGNEYIGFDFNISLLADNDSSPKARLTLMNVNEDISKAVLESTSQINIDIEILPLSEFNLKNFPRTQINTPALRVYRAKHLRLADVEGDLMQISGNIQSWDYSQETWPALKATESRFPGLFWS